MWRRVRSIVSAHQLVPQTGSAVGRHAEPTGRRSFQDYLGVLPNCAGQRRRVNVWRRLRRATAEWKKGYMDGYSAELRLGIPIGGGERRR